MRGLTFLLLACLSGLLPGEADAQRKESLVAGFKAERDSLSLAKPGTRSDTASSAAPGRAARVRRNAIYGAVLGGVTGFLAATVLNTQNTDHTEDGMLYGLLVVPGAVVGLCAGIIVGLTRGP